MLQPMRDMIERVGPCHALQLAAGHTDHWMEETPLKPEGFAKSRALGTEATKICRMIGIAGNCRSTLAVRRREHAAAYAAIRARRSRGFEGGIERCHAVPRMTVMLVA